MTDETTNRNCEHCDAEIPSTAKNCPACGTLQENVELPPPAPTGFGSFTLEDDDEAPAPKTATGKAASVTSEAKEPTPDGSHLSLEPELPETVSSEDIPVEEVDDEPAHTIRMSVADIGKAWIEETDGDLPDEPATPAQPVKKGKGCMPVMLLLLIVPTALVIALLT